LGIVSRQASWSTFLNYFGFAIGFVNVAYLMTNWFSPEELGLRNFILDIAVVVAQFAHLGTFQSLVKFFPFFNRNTKEGDNGLLSIGLIIPFIGFLSSALLLIVFKDNVIAKFDGDSTLFEQFYWAIFPLIFFILYQSIFESYLQAKSITIFSAFLKNVFNRLVITILMVLYYVHWIDFYGFIVLVIGSYALNVLLFIGYLIWKGEFNFQFRNQFFTKRVRRIYFNYSAYSILGGVSSALINKFDAIMIGFYLGLTSNAVYTNAYFISTLIYLPADAIGKISISLISNYWKEKRIDKIGELYQKSSLNQLLIGGLLFILIWSSLDNLYFIQKEVFATGKYVFLLLGLSKVINMSFGLNSQILFITKYYRFDTTTSLLLAAFTIMSNALLIPIWGIEGASAATLISILVFNVVRYFYVQNKLGIQPFNWATLKALVVLLLAFVLGTYLPDLDNFILDTLYKSTIITLFVAVPVLAFNISEDITSFYRKGLKNLKLID